MDPNEIQKDINNQSHKKIRKKWFLSVPFKQLYTRILSGHRETGGKENLNLIFMTIRYLSTLNYPCPN